MLLNLTTFSSEPIYSQIVFQILDKIIENELNPDEELVSVGKMSRQHHIGKGTIRKAYKELESLGAVKSIQNERYIVNNLSEDQITFLIDQQKWNGISKKKKEKIGAELEAAREIQKGMFPKELPDNTQISVSAFSTLSTEVCGDFYDFYQINENSYGILIGDASGKGLPAAMLITQIHAIIKSDISHRRSVQQTLFLLNAYLKNNSAAKNFATLFYGKYDLESKKLRYANAGHNYPIIVKKDGKIENVKTTGPALGIINNIEYEVKEVDIENGDLLFLFTDGLPEAMNKNGHQFGEDKIIEYCSKNNKKKAADFITGMKTELFQFRAKQNETDDITFMVIKKNEL